MDSNISCLLPLWQDYPTTVYFPVESNSSSIRNTVMATGYQRVLSDMRMGDANDKDFAALAKELLQEVKVSLVDKTISWAEMYAIVTKAVAVLTAGASLLNLPGSQKKVLVMNALVKVFDYTASRLSSTSQMFMATFRVRSMLIAIIDGIVEGIVARYIKGNEVI